MATSSKVPKSKRERRAEDSDREVLDELDRYIAEVARQIPKDQKGVADGDEKPTTTKPATFRR
jgi:hypothetical protein